MEMSSYVHNIAATPADSLARFVATAVCPYVQNAVTLSFIITGAIHVAGNATMAY
jgi:Zn ribbon nucleic-acid-binding protein